MTIVNKTGSDVNIAKGIEAANSLLINFSTLAKDGETRLSGLAQRPGPWAILILVSEQNCIKSSDVKPRRVRIHYAPLRAKSAGSPQIDPVALPQRKAAQDQRVKPVLLHQDPCG